MDVKEAEAILRERKFKTIALRAKRQQFGEAKATLFAKAPEVLKAIGRFPPGAGRLSTDHRRDPQSKRSRTRPSK